MQDEKLLDAPTDTRLPWSRQSRMDTGTGKLMVESTPAFSAFVLYRDAGERRSLARVSEECGKSVSLVERWSARWHWSERVKLYDDHLDDQVLKGMAGERIRMGQRQARLAMKGQDLASRLLTEIGEELSQPTSEIIGGKTVASRRRPSLSESARLLDISSRLEQSVRGRPSESAVANVIIHVELQKQPRYLSVAEASADPTSEQS